MDFAALKKKRTELQDKLKQKVENLNSNESFKDDRVWKITQDKSGNGNAILRYLMAPKDEDFPFVRYFSHTFKGPGGWYIENCLTTLGQNCPVCEANSILWNSEIEANKAIARERKRKLTYVSNVLIINDPANKDNNGKVFLFKYGQKIFEKINDLLHPTIEGEESINPFDFWDGCNFKLRISKVAGYPNYDKSQFDSVSPLLGGDESKIEAVWTSEYSLSEFIDPKQFKSYDELKVKFEKVVGNVSGKRTRTAAEVDAPKEQEAPQPSRSRAPRKPKEVEAPTVEEDAPPFDEGTEEDELAYFEKLARGE